LIGALRVRRQLTPAKQDENKVLPHIDPLPSWCTTTLLVHHHLLHFPGEFSQWAVHSTIIRTHFIIVIASRRGTSSAASAHQQHQHHHHHRMPKNPRAPDSLMDYLMDRCLFELAHCIFTLIRFGISAAASISFSIKWRCCTRFSINLDV